MAEAASPDPNAELLEWPKKDKRRFLHVVYRVGDLDRTIKYDAAQAILQHFAFESSDCLFPFVGFCFQVLY